MVAGSQSIALPRMRPDLELFPGPPLPDGSATWTLHDPLAGVFHKVEWAEAEVLRRLRKHRTLDSLMRDLSETTTLRLTPEDVMQFCQQIRAEKLTVDSRVDDPDVLSARHRALRPHWLMWLLSHYLYIRVPLLHPDRFLARTLPYVRVLASRAALAAYGVLFLAGLFLLLPRLDAYARTFPYFFNWRGVAAYLAALVAVKAIHEFTHAYTAKHFGVRVPTMGVALMVFCPVAFCDVTDAWRLRSRRARLAISLAGIASELILAGLALFLWGITSGGTLHSLFFVLSSVTVLSTLLVNLNPAMRFDGYYILMDLWGIDNLRPRAFAMTRWALHRWLLGIDLPPPETGVARRRLGGMVVYSLYAWAYRFFLYLGIAVLVYYKFGKALGLILFLAEIGFFLVRPAVVETLTLVRLREHVRVNPRLCMTGGVLLLLLLWLALPLPRSYAAPALVVPDDARSQVVFAPAEGVLADVEAGRDAPVRSGDMLFRIESHELEAREKSLRIEERILETRRLRAVIASEYMLALPEIREDLEETRARLRVCAEQKRLNVVRAQVDGIVYEWDEAVRVGLPVAKGTEIGRIANRAYNRAVAFVKEERVAGVETGNVVRFIAANGNAPRSGTVLSIAPLRQETLPHAALASVFSGDLPVWTSGGQELTLAESVYRVDVVFDGEQMPPPMGQTGRMWFRSPPRSLFLDAWRYAWRVLVRESGL